MAAAAILNYYFVILDHPRNPLVYLIGTDNAIDKLKTELLTAIRPTFDKEIW